MKYKTIVFLLLTFYCIIIGCSKEKHFNIDGIITNDFKGYIYLNYNDTRDSFLVKNNKFHFKGKISSGIVYIADFSTQRTSAMDKTFYLENEDIKINLTIEDRKIRTTELDWIIINNVSGTKTSILQKEYQNFQETHQNDSDWLKKHYKKVDEIVSNNPKNQYSGELVGNLISSDTLTDIKELQKIYKKLDLESQDPIMKINLKGLLYPEDTIKIGKSVMDFELSNTTGKKIKISDMKGSIVLIDFWASWCVPCRKEFPKIKKINEEFESKNFKILGVSLDENKNSWLKIIKEDNLLWENVIDTSAFNSKIAYEYNIIYIPSNLLIDENGIIIGHNLKPEELKLKLEEILN